MKRTLILGLIIVLLMNTIAFANNNEILNSEDVILTIPEEIRDDVQEKMKEHLTKISEKMKEHLTEIGFYDIEASEEEDATLRNETIFVTGIEGNYYFDPDAVPTYMDYTYIRPSDGAIFRGTLGIYYVRFKVITYDPLSVEYQGWYEGDLTLIGYIY